LRICALFWNWQNREVPKGYSIIEKQEAYQQKRHAIACPLSLFETTYG
jgi:hypothetical protein